jgi:tryptophanyl-tRNA synthetase
MSKSIGGSGCLWLLDDPKVSAKRIRSAVTDTGREVTYDVEAKPGVSNLLTILSALTDTPIPALEERFIGAGYGDLKKEVAEAYLVFAEPFAARVHELIADSDTLDDVLADGAARARAQAGPLLNLVFDRVGFLPGRR